MTDEEKPDPTHQALTQLFAAYEGLISTNVYDYITRTTQLVFPTVPQSLMETICDRCAQLFRKEPVVLNLPHDIVIVGDIHGHILDLFRILNCFGFPPKQKYLFLGDIVDRGEFSTETITLVYLMKVLWPEHVFLLRGNHEFSEMCQRCGFSAELYSIYASGSLESTFHCAFSWTPLAAVIDNTILCIHGGIGPEFKRVDQLKDSPRPLYDFDREPATTVLWSDPMKNLRGFRQSSRGCGFFFGESALTNFLHENGLTTVVRGHQSIEDGVDMSMPGLVTVFSASSYCGMRANKAGVYVLRPDDTREAVTFPPLPYFRREMVSHTILHDLSLRPVERVLDGPLSGSRLVAKLPSLGIKQKPKKGESATSRLRDPRSRLIRKDFGFVGELNDRKLVKELMMAEGAARRHVQRSRSRAMWA